MNCYGIAIGGTSAIVEISRKRNKSRPWYQHTVERGTLWLWFGRVHIMFTLRD